MRCGCQWPSAVDKYACFDIMSPIAPEPGSTVVCAPSAALVRAIIADFGTPARTQRVRCRSAANMERAPAALKHIGARILEFQKSASSKRLAHERSTTQTNPFL